MAKIMTFLSLLTLGAQNVALTSQMAYFEYLDHNLDEVKYVDPRIVEPKYISDKEIKVQYRIDDDVWKDYRVEADFTGSRIQFRITELQITSTVEIINNKCFLSNGHSVVVDTTFEYLFYWKYQIVNPERNSIFITEDLCNAEKRDKSFSREWKVGEDSYDWTVVRNEAYLEYTDPLDGQAKQIYANLSGATFIMQVSRLDGFFAGTRMVSEKIDIYDHIEIYLSPWINIDTSSSKEELLTLDKHHSESQIIDMLCKSGTCNGIDKDIFINNISFIKSNDALILKTKQNNLKDYVLVITMPPVKPEPINSNDDSQLIIILSLSFVFIIGIVIFMFKKWNK